MRTGSPSLKESGGSDWLFVGRLVPAKAQHDLVKALWAFHRLYDPQARLHLVSLFEVFPPGDPRVARARGTLSSLLF